MAEHDTSAQVGAGVRQLGGPDIVLPGQVDRLASALGDPPGVLVVGESGVGKSAAVGQLLRRLRADGWLVAAHIGQWVPALLFQAVAEAILLARSDDSRLQEYLTVLAAPGDELAKLDVVGQLLAEWPLVVVFDDLGRNCDAECGRFIDPGFAAVLDRLCRAADRGRIVATSRCPVPEARRLRQVQVEFTPDDAIELAARLRPLNQLDPDDRTTVATLLLRRPRLMALGGTWLAAGGGFEQLGRAAMPAHVMPIAGDPPQQWATLRENLLGLLLELLTPAQRELLLHAALSPFPLSAEDLAAVAASAPGGDPATVAADATRLVSLGLAVHVRPHEWYVEPWVADGLGKHQGSEYYYRGGRLITMHLAKINGGRASLLDVIAICRQLTDDPAKGDPAEYTLAAVGSNRGLRFAALLGEVVPHVRTNHPRLAELVERQVALLREGGFHDAANEAEQRYHGRPRPLFG